jgi:soluble lytic murein transglycosylase-like protein
MGDRVRSRATIWAAATLALVVAGGCGLVGGHDEPQAAPEFVSASPSDTGPEFEAIEESATPEPAKTTKAPAKKPKKPKATKATPTGPANNFQAAACFDYDGKAVSKSKVKSALNAAAAKHYWPVSEPTLMVPADLVRSIAWNESGWQNNIVNCDGGYGLMQLMPGTVDQMNQRFEKSYDVKDYRQNAVIGANYLAWMTRYLGHLYFHDNFSLSTSKCKSASSWCLLNTVIAGYHAGVGSVEANAAQKKLPSPDYVYVVRSLMSSCYCDTY